MGPVVEARMPTGRRHWRQNSNRTGRGSCEDGYTWMDRITNVRGLSSTLDGDGGVAAPKIILPTFLQFQEGWGDFSPFFLPVQQENCLLIESKDFLYSSRRAKL